MTYSTHVTDGIDLLVSPITFDAASGVSNVTGATVSAWAINKTAGTKTAAATCTVTSATSIRATWTPGTLVAGNYNVQVYATPSGHAIQTVSDTDWTVKPAAGP